MSESTLEDASIRQWRRDYLDGLTAQGWAERAVKLNQKSFVDCLSHNDSATPLRENFFYL